ETVAPRVLTLPPDIEAYQPPNPLPKDAKPYKIRGEFLFHCHVEMHMMQGLVGLVRVSQVIYLTPADKAIVEATTGLPLAPNNNDCPTVDLARCNNSMGGQWQTLPNLPEVTMMHAVLLANTNRVLYWGYGPQLDQSRVWDQATGLYTQPANQPQTVQ